MATNRFKFLVFLIMLIFVHRIAAQPDRQRDSVELLLSSDKQSIQSLTKLNYLIEQIWKTHRVSDSTINQAIIIVEHARTTEDDMVLADALINLVRCYLNRYESTKSLEHALEANKLYEKLNDKGKMAYTTLQLGVVYYTQNNFQKSLEYYLHSLNMYTELKDTLRMSTLLYLCGINYTRLNEYGKADSNFKKALELKIKVNDLQGIAECNVGLGEMMLMQNNPDNALIFIDEAFRYIKSDENNYGLAKTKLLQSRALAMKNKYPEAFEAANTALKIAQEMDARELIVDAHEQLYQLHVKKGNYKEAYSNLYSYMTLRDSIFNEKTSRNFSRLETDYIIEKKQSEILLLENQNRNRNILLRASIIIGILSILLSLLFYSRYQIKQKANKELQQAYKDLEKTQQQLIQQEKLASLGQLTAGIAHEIKNPLNFVNNFSLISNDLIKEFRESDDPVLKSELIEDLEKNLAKISQHGQRANSIVTKMLEHSRGEIGEKQLTDINRLCREDTNLAYKAILMSNPGFNCEIQLDLNESLPKVMAVAQEISRVILNIVNNCFHALLEKKKISPEHSPILKVSTTISAKIISISIRDNGTGIKPEITEKIFHPFFTTKPSGEGTGLGLSISYDIIKAHGGNIVAGNNADGGAEFIITLPLTS